MKMPDFRCVALKTARASTCVMQLCAALDHLHELSPESCCTSSLYKMSSVGVCDLIHRAQTHPDVVISGYV